MELATTGSRKDKNSEDDIDEGLRSLIARLVGVGSCKSVRLASLLLAPLALIAARSRPIVLAVGLALTGDIAFGSMIEA